MDLNSSGKHRAFFISSVILMISVFSAEGQNFTINNFTTRDGIPHNNVRTIVRDSTGYLWIGTWDGLSRFDGNTFKNYFHSPGDTSSLPFFSVHWLCLDRMNNLWILTDWGQVVKYNRASDNFSVVKNIGAISIERANSISTDEEGNLIILTNTEIISWNTGNGNLQIYGLQDQNHQPYDFKNIMCSASLLNNSELWVAGSEILKFGRDGKKFSLQKEYRLLSKQPDKAFDFDFHNWFSFYKSKSGKNWIFSNIGLYKLDEDSDCFREYLSQIPANEFSGRKLFYWGCRDQGIFIYNSSQKKISHIPFRITKMPCAIFPDNNIVWFSCATTSGIALGISQLVFTPDYFRNYLINDKDSVAREVCSVIMDRDRNIWTGVRGYDHVVLYDTGNSVRKIDKHTVKPGNETLNIRAMLPEQDGIWIGLNGRLLQFYDYNNKNFTNYYPGVSSLRVIASDKSGNIYIAADNLYSFHPKTRTLDLLWQSGKTDGIFKIFPDKNGIIWCAMANSRLLKYNTQTSESKIIDLSKYKCDIEDVIQGDDGILWLAILGEGVCRYEIKSGSCRFYTTSSGLSNNTAYSLLRDKSGNIWVSTNNGISRINPYTEQIKNFGITDGLGISEFNSGAKFISSDDDFFFGGMGGFVRFSPDSVTVSEAHEQQQKIMLTGLEVSGLPRFLPRSLDESDTIIFNTGENNFHLTFSSSDFANSDNTLYRYKLSGLNKTWIKTGAFNRNINYANLKPGWHQLTIEATDANGNWSHSKNLMIRMTPYFYQTLFFIIVVPSLLLLTFILSIVFYIRNLKQKAEQMQNQLKLAALRGQMNPHFIFNSLNSINYFISNNDRLSANRYIADFSRLIRSLLTNIMNDFIPVNDEISSIEDYLRIEHLRFGDQFDYEIKKNEAGNLPGTEICPGLVQPFIENAIWHGVRPLEKRKGMIRINFISSGENFITCIIEDDGIGRKASFSRKDNNGNHKSKGISIVKERLQIRGKIMGTSFRLEINDLFPDRVETGTKVEVEIPIINRKKT